ncbi:MAG: hypothetical protein BGO54_07795 [Sphingobacteriales bacterium 46-32]|nr:MAG: hypothetical protein BGO54_07795 [Sphingobacteriales bacterium 46-32]
METVTKSINSKSLIEFPNEFTRSSLLSLAKQIDLSLALREKRTLIQVVTELGKKENFGPLLSCISNDEVLIDNVIKNSYRHDNGFHKIVLLSSHYFKLRLHLFQPIPEIPLPMENIHNHRWNFASKIISGSLKMELFREDDSGGVEVNNYTYLSKNGSDQYAVEYNGKINLERLSLIRYDSGCTYFMKSKELHRIINPNNESTCTLMITGSPLSEKCKLYSYNTFLNERQTVSSYSEEELRELFLIAVKG